jgi:hypothetical protein
MLFLFYWAEITMCAAIFLYAKGIDFVKIYTKIIIKTSEHYKSTLKTS